MDTSHLFVNTYHRIRRRLLRKARHIRRHHAKNDRKVRSERHIDTVAEEASPLLTRINLTDHDRADDRDGQVGGDEVRSGILEVRGAAAGSEDEDALEGKGDDLDEEGVEGGEAEAFDEDRAELLIWLRLVLIVDWYGIWRHLRSAHRRWRHWWLSG